MDDNNLEKLHNAILYIADEVDRICRKENIHYTLTGGSLIGAVRHKGFIPWDDDMDIAMLRNDYEMFLDACNKELRNTFFIQTIETDLNYPYGFAKLTLKGTNYVQEGHEGEKWQKGIFVDIFPMDNVPDKEIQKFFHKTINYLLIKLLQCKENSGIGKESKTKVLIGFLLTTVSKFFSIAFLTKHLQHNMKKYMGADTKMVCNLGGYYKYEKETTKRSYYKDYIETSFSDRKYMIIKEYDLYLKKIYGNYMELPPIEKRRTHNFSILDFGDFEF